MAKGFGKGFVTGVAGTVAAVAGAVYTFKKKSNRNQKNKKAAFIEENRKKSSSPSRITLINKKRSWKFQLLFMFLNSQIKFQLRFHWIIVNQLKILCFNIKEVGLVWYIQNQTWLAI